MPYSTYNPSFDYPFNQRDRDCSHDAPYYDGKERCETPQVDALQVLRLVHGGDSTGDVSWRHRRVVQQLLQDAGLSDRGQMVVDQNLGVTQIHEATFTVNCAIRVRW